MKVFRKIRLHDLVFGNKLIIGMIFEGLHVMKNNSMAIAEREDGGVRGY